ncbi:MAG: MAPEG family protein [Gammaproteobacteria bacterium]|nr:MAPEG family protein [Gammaproteobacteria bacterium]MBU1724112.1 MAPEG family protein [Gammaproteobacteria bacterium]MBU2006812.1 MAPEG family protein [Gammaproteobacteria bacterium]
MPQTFVLYPAFAMALLTFAVAIWLLRCRIKAVKAGLTPAYFKLNHGARLPDYLVQATQHYDNLFEMPVLFYVVVVLTYVTQQADWALLLLAWAYVGARIAHAGIHLTHNKLRQRMRVFLLSYGLLVLIWGWLFVRLVTA